MWFRAKAEFFMDVFLLIFLEISTCLFDWRANIAKNKAMLLLFDVDVILFLKLGIYELIITNDVGLCFRSVFTSKLAD